jgi:glucose-1-phosphate thymidylyltransferase
MKAIILCAGKGTRLRPLTHTSAKHLIPVMNKPVLLYSIEKIKQAGITDIGLIVSPDNKESFEDVFADGSDFGVKLEYIVQKDPKGLAHAVLCAKEYIGEDDFLMYLGDNLIKEDLDTFIESFKDSKADATILLAPVENPSRFGVAKMKGNNIVAVIEKPKNPPSNLAIIGVYIFSKAIFEGIANIKPSWRNELEITDAIGYLINNNFTVNGHIIYSWWKDTGMPDDIIEANRRLLEDLADSNVLGNIAENSLTQGKIVIGKGTNILNSVVRGPVIIGENCTITDAYIGPFTSIGDNVDIKNAEVENSIIMENSKLINLDTKVDSSLIGKNVFIKEVEGKPKSLKIVLGDHSQLTLKK